MQLSIRSLILILTLSLSVLSCKKEEEEGISVGYKNQLGGGNPNPNGTNTGGNTGSTAQSSITINAAQETISSPGCSTQSGSGQFQLSGSTVSGKSALIIFSTTPTAGTYTCTANPTPATGEAYLNISYGGNAYIALAGSVSVGVTSGKVKVSFSGLNLISGSNTINASGSISCP